MDYERLKARQRSAREGHPPRGARHASGVDVVAHPRGIRLFERAQAPCRLQRGRCAESGPLDGGSGRVGMLNR